MYEERKKKINWKGFLIKLLLVFVIVFLIIKLIPFNNNKKDANGHSKIFNNSFTTLKEVGNSYFTKDNLPSEDEETKITLKELIKDKKISKLKGADKKSCNEDKSYIKSYKKNIGYELEVYLECGEESDSSYIYLGCFDDCNVTNKNDSENNTKKTTTTSKETTTIKNSKTTTTTTAKSSKTTTKNNAKTTTQTTTTTKTTTTKSPVTTTKKVTNNNYTYKTTTKVPTTTTTRVKKYAVIFNENGGSKVATQSVLAGTKATMPANPSKTGFEFLGWYLNDVLYDFNTPVNNNIILIAKWKIASRATTKTYTQNVYNVVTVNENSNEIYAKASLNYPDEVKNSNYATIKSITYIRNFNNTNDIQKYLGERASIYKYEEGFINNDATISNFGSVDNIDIQKYQEGENANTLYWNALVNNKCTDKINNKCSYGIVYRVIWEYEV